MASGGRDKPVLLGFVDEYAASDRENFYTNKVHPYYFCPLTMTLFVAQACCFWNLSELDRFLS